MLGQITLTPVESKRLIAKGVVATGSVQNALKNHTIVLAGGTTNGFIAEEILGLKFDKITDYTIGVIADGKTGLSPEEARIPPFVISKGKAKDKDYHWKTYLDEIKPGDLFIKGGNAIDHTGLTGVLASNEQGGTIGAAWGTLIQRGIGIIVPIGLEKLVPDVRAAVELTAKRQTNLAKGDRVALMPLLGGTSYTEIDAFKTLFDLTATCIGAGGINGTEGAITLVLDGDEDNLKKAMNLVDEIKMQ